MYTHVEFIYLFYSYYSLKVRLLFAYCYIEKKMAFLYTSAESEKNNSITQVIRFGSKSEL